MTTPDPRSQSYPGFKIALFGLLLGNTVLYALGETPSQALDSMGWLMLLALFEWEAEFAGRWQGRSVTAAIHLTRLAAIIGIGAATGAYLYQQVWLDVINSGLWLAVVVLLEYEMRFPQVVARRARAFLTTAAVIYAGLVLLVVVWAWRGEWLDAYDALLWIIAFATIETDVLRYSKRAAPAP